MNKSRVKSRSPYGKVKPRINNRSVTLDKHDLAVRKNEVYL